MSNLAPYFVWHIGRTDEGFRTKKPASASQRASSVGIEDRQESIRHIKA
jgi:hypothetical protein